ncbi:hypothetical protein TraAM80_04659 [Trypanosoma rangeli]|uniref:Ubiquitin-like domain-containing protein n=1 Tax=Trypanosoma rangeli TaxID=5698 RepID=A0A422NIE0_TRYRA|nr:uncharacterized protein TraAM80_04659 [Trypanosoma rangeli]RNF05248.1 hypothetical protein TraAM80_04659 [Trypanosoma rangeli]|eukprot:RNF05248.1 hypothetical protein TraAM80_04659 [Trypanosoma rangeli]
MIIRLIGDSWFPEEKLLISVREDSEIKASLPNIMKKLMIKRICEYKFYRTIGERKCDYGQLIDPQSTWRELGISSGSAIYLSKKEPTSMEESTKASNVAENKEKDEKEVPVNVPASEETLPILPPTVPIVTTNEDCPDKTLLTHPQQESSPMHTTTLDSFFPIEVGSSSQVKTVDFPLQPSHSNEERDIVVSACTHGSTKKRTQGYRHQANLASVLQESQCHVNKSEVTGFSIVPEVNYSAFYASRATSSPLAEKNSMDLAQREVMLRRCERTAYMVSLYEFAHLEFQRQRRRAEELRREPQRGLSRSTVSQSQLLYKI